LSFLPLAILPLVLLTAPADALALAAACARRGDPAAAAGIYDLLSFTGIHNGAFYLNQGNAHYLAGNLPEAVLAYRRAERLIPNDARLRANLTEARQAVIDPPVPARPGWPAWMPAFSCPSQARLALSCYLLAWTVLAFGLLRESWRWHLAGVFLLLATLALGFVIHRGEQQDGVRPVAVVTADGMVLRVGNGVSYPPVELNGITVKLNRGVETRVRGQRANGWVQVELANGLTGWVPRAGVLMDREPPS
jgi:hypothetical protein